MSKKENNSVRLDKQGVPKVMHVFDYFADSLGMFSLNAISGLVGQLTYFYTDKVGIAAGAIATMFLVCKIIDAFTDLIMGHICDSTKPGKEKYRPWLLRAGIPAGVMLALLFMVPKGAGQTVQLIYMCITNLLMTAILYTAISIPYGAIMMIRTPSQEERGIMGTWRAAAGYVSGMVIAIAVIPITNMMGGDQSAWIKMGVIFGILIVINMVICWKCSKESAVDTRIVSQMETKTLEEMTDEEYADHVYRMEQDAADSNLSMAEAVKCLFKSKYWIIWLAVNLFNQITYGLTNSSGTYYCKWIYGNDNLVAILGGIGMLPTLVGFILAMPMIKKLGAVKTLRVSFFLGAAANALRLLNPYHFWYNAILGCICTFATIPPMCVGGVIGGMNIQYNEHEFGARIVARSGSASSFGMKIASGIGASIVGWCLAIANYDPAMTVATEATKQAIFTFSIYIPLVAFLMMFLLMFKYDLEKKLPEINKDLAEKEAKRKAEIIAERK